MTFTPDSVDAVIADLDAISDPMERFERAADVEFRMSEGLRKVRQRIAVELYDGGRRTYREVGQIMGGVSAQRAEQIAKGRGSSMSHTTQPTRFARATEGHDPDTATP